METMKTLVKTDKEKIFGGGERGTNIGIIVMVGITLLSLVCIVLLLSLAGVYLWPLTAVVIGQDLTSDISWLPGYIWIFAVLALLAVICWWQKPGARINRRKDETLLFNAGIDYKKGKEISNAFQKWPIDVILFSIFLGISLVFISGGWPSYLLSSVVFVALLFALRKDYKREQGKGLSEKIMED